MFIENLERWDGGLRGTIAADPAGASRGVAVLWRDLPQGLDACSLGADVHASLARTRQGIGKDYADGGDAESGEHVDDMMTALDRCRDQNSDVQCQREPAHIRELARIPDDEHRHHGMKRWKSDQDRKSTRLNSSH